MARTYRKRSTIRRKSNGPAPLQTNSFTGGTALGTVFLAFTLLIAYAVYAQNLGLGLASCALFLGMAALYVVNQRPNSVLLADIPELEEIDAMSGIQFEHFLVSLFRRLGFAVEHVGQAGDHGCDLILSSGKARIAVQAKCLGKPSSGAAVSEVHTSMRVHGCGQALAVCNRGFTSDARYRGKMAGVLLWDRQMLAAKIVEAKNPPTVGRVSLIS